MSELVVECLKDLNVMQLIATGIMMWFFYSRLDRKMDRIEKKLDAKIDKLELKVDKLAEKVEDIDRRLCRIEGSMSIHGHCLFSQSHMDKKAE